MATPSGLVKLNKQCLELLICVISADNPANNLLGGFKETTSAHHMCRQCMATHSQATSKVTVLVDTYVHVDVL